MLRVVLRDWGTQLLGREAGGRAHREAVAQLHRSCGEGIVIDCHGVTDMTASFADELFGRLSERGVDAGLGPVKVEGLDPSLRAIVRTVIQKSPREAVA